MQSAFKDVAKYSDELEKPVCSDVAIMYDYDSLAAFRIQKQSILLDTQKEMEKFYKAFYDKFAAVTRKSQGQGVVYYVACSLDEATMKLVMGRIMEDNSICGEVTEDGVEVCYRGDDSSKIRVVMNHTGEERRYGDAVLAPYESRIDRV